MENPDHPFFRLMEQHRSIRSFVQGAEVPADHLERIVAAAQRSPTSCNLQTYSFLAIRDRQTRERIAAVSGGHRFIVEAGLLLVALVDLHKMEVVTRRAGYRYYQSQFLESFLMAAMDTAIAAQSALIAAEALGYGVCMLGSIRNHSDRAIEILQLPPKLFPLVGLAIGVPERLNAPRPRLPLQGVLFQERYDPARVEAAIEEYDRLMRESGVYEGREFPLDEVERVEPAPAGRAGGRHTPGAYGWIEHSARRVSSRNPEDARDNLSEVLRRAEFGLK